MVVVQGEPGMGKTRLIREFAKLATAGALPAVDGEARLRTAEAGVVVATGHAVDLAGGAIPFGLVSSLLSDFVVAVGTELVMETLGARAADLAPLIPVLGDPGPGDLDRLRVYGTVQHLLVALSAETPLLLFAEDVHWADSQSRDLLNFLSRSIARGCLLLVFTSRPVADDEIGSFTSQLGHLVNGQLITLPPLTDEAVRAQIEASGVVLPQPIRDRVVALSEGVPLYVEELAAAGYDELEAGQTLPSGLGVNLASRAVTVSRGARQALRAAAVHDQPFTSEQIAMVLDWDDAMSEAALDEAVADGVLDALPHQRFRFHHALIRAALEESFSPSTRVRWHRRWAAVLNDGATAEQPATIVAVADHLFRAGGSAEAVAACMRAAQTSQRLGAPGDAVLHWRRVIEMFDARPELGSEDQRNDALAASRLALGVDWPGVRDLALVESARRPAATGLRAVWLWGLDIASARQLQLAVRLPAPAEVREAVTVVDQAVPSLMAVQAAESLVRIVVHYHPDETALRDDALRVMKRSALAVGNRRYISTVEEWLGWIDTQHGRHTRALRRMEELARHPDNDMADTVYYEGLVTAFVLVLGPLDEGLRRGSAAMRLIPHPTAHASWSYLAFQLSVGHRLAGDWDAVDELHKQLAAIPSWMSSSLILKGERAVLALDRGDLIRARSELNSMRTQLPDPEGSNLGVVMWSYIPLVAALVAAADGDGERAATELARVLTDARWESASAEVWQCLVLAAQLAWRLPTSDPHWISTVRDALARTNREGLMGKAYTADAEANLARAENHEVADLWEHAADAWSDVGAAHFEAVCRLRLAQTLLPDATQRSAAIAQLAAALSTANRLGAIPLADEIHDLAGRARLSLDPSDGPGSPREVAGKGRRLDRGRPSMPTRRTVGSLTARELDVLALLAEGNTNDQIGRALFMSPKTASVHVSRIIDKLGAANRTQVVAIAHRAGLLQDRGASEE